MKKYLSLFVLLAGTCFSGFAQSKMLLPGEVYSEMKAKGQLKPDVEYILINETKQDNVQSHRITDEYVKELKHNKTPSGCSCIVPLDGTFNVAEFSGYFGPDYRNDDGSTNAKALPFNFCLYGTNYNQLYINNNGNVSFGSSHSTFSSDPFPNNTYVMVAPFWADVDTRDAGSGLVYYKITPTYMIVKWEAVGYYSQQSDKLNTFQLIITNGSDPILPNGNNVAFCYGDMQWTTGSASSGVNGFGGTPATVGINKGDGINYIQLGQFDQSGVAYDGGYGLSDGVSWLDNQSFYFNGCGSGGSNLAPIANGLNNCDTLKICGSGDTLILNGLFLAPELGQTTTVTVNTNGTPNATILNNTPGNSATAQVMIIATLANGGNNVITFTATDDGSPAATTVINVNVFVDTAGLANFNPQITGSLNFCQGSSTVLSVAPTNYDSYVWNTGSNNTSITVDSTGQYWVTSEKNGCYKTNIVQVTESLLPTPVISGYPYACNGGVTTLTVDSLIYASYQWNTLNTNDSVIVGGGTYSVTVTDSNGCVATSPPVTVIAPIAPVITGITTLCNGGLATLTTTIPYATYNWTDSFGTNFGTNDSAFVPGGTYTVAVVDINGCNITSAPFTVSATFFYSLSFSGDTTFCAGQSINLVATGTPALGASYQWSTSASGSSINVNSGGNYTVTLSYPNGCSADTTVTVPAPITIPSPIITGYPFTCGGTTDLTVDPLIYASYLWTTGSTTVSTNDSVSVPDGTYNLTVEDAFGCVADTFITIVPAIPPVISGLTALCNGDSAVLSTTYQYANYLWTPNANTTDSITVYNGTYSVTVTDLNGCVLTSDPFIVTIFNYSMSFTGDTTFCSGQAIALTASESSSPPATPAYFWSTGDSTSFISVNAGGNYTVTITYPNGCTADTTVTVPTPLPLPTPVITGITPICPGATTTLSAGPLAYQSYNWSNLDPNPSVTVGAGAYTVTVFDGLCFGTSPSFIVALFPTTPPVITGATAVCNGAPTDLTTTLAYSNYNWFNSAGTNFGSNDSIQILPGTYSVSTLDANGCNVTSAPFNVSSFNYSLFLSGNIPYCVGQNITLTASTDNPVGASYLWSPGGSSSASISVNTGATYTVTLSYTNGCTTDTTVTVAPPNPLPTPTIIGTLFTCHSDPTTLSVNPSYSTYNWSNFSTGSTISVLSGTYNVTVTDANNCTGTSASVIVDNLSPVVTISGNQQFCPHDSIELFANPSIISPNPTSYLWSNGDNVSSTFVSAPGTYIVTITYVNGCSADTSVVVTQYPAPLANFTSSPLGMANANTVVNFSDLSTIASGMITYWHWNFGDNSTDFVPNPAHTFVEDGVYPVSLLVASSYGCMDSIRIEYNVISDIQVPNVITPSNPGPTGVNQYFYVKNLKYFPGTSLKVYNRWGKKVYETDNYQNDYGGENHPDGVYYYVLEGDLLKNPVYGFFQILR